MTVHRSRAYTHIKANTKLNNNATKIMVNYKWFYYRFRTTTVDDNNAITDDNRRWRYRALCGVCEFEQTRTKGGERGGDWWPFSSRLETNEKHKSVMGVWWVYYTWWCAHIPSASIYQSKNAYSAREGDANLGPPETFMTPLHSHQDESISICSKALTNSETCCPTETSVYAIYSSNETSWTWNVHKILFDVYFGLIRRLASPNNIFT